MVTQDMVDAHANRVKEVVLAFEERVAVEIDSVVAETSSRALATLSTSRGVVRQTQENARKTLAIEDVFKKSLDASEYYPTVLAFVTNFADQVGEFTDFYGEMSKGLRIPDMELKDGDYDVLSHQAGVAMSTLEGYPMKVTFELRQLLARSLGESNVSELVQGISDVIRKMTKVGPIAKDQLVIFLRLVGSLVYKNVEDLGHSLTYAYVGSEPTRDFCSSLFGKHLTREEIATLENDQFPNVMVSGGGHGCGHWWAISGVANAR